MKTLECLLLANNRISKIEVALSKYLPNLARLILTHNNIEELGDLDPLAGFDCLTELSLMGCPVAQKEYYRSYVIHRCPKLRFLDYRRIEEKVSPTQNHLHI